MINLATEFEGAFARLIKTDPTQSWDWTWARRDSEGSVTYPRQSRILGAEVWGKVVSGSASIGVFLANPQTMVTKAGVIDIDCPRDGANLEDVLALAQTIAKTASEAGLRAYVEFSGRRGYHVWIFADEALPSETMGKALKTLARKAGYDAKETYPHITGGKETKGIKLPGAVHLGSGKRSGFLDSEGNCQDSIKTQIELLASFELSPKFKLVELALGLESSKPASDPHKPERVERGLITLGDQLPACIAHLTSSGAVLELDYHLSNTLLSRYAVTKGLKEDEAIALAESMANASDHHTTTKKTVEAKVKHFESCFKSARDNPTGYRFDCGYVLGGLNGLPASTRGCIGTKCPVHKDHHPDKPSATTKRPLNRFIFETLINLLAEGKEPVKSLILEGVEKRLDTPKTQPQNANVPESQTIKEFEVLSTLLKFPEYILDASDILPLAFEAVTNQDPSEYIESVFGGADISQTTLNAHLTEIRNRGVKNAAYLELNNTRNKIGSSNSPVEILSEHGDKIKYLAKKAIGDRSIAPISDSVADLIDLLFSSNDTYFKTFSAHLNNIYNGGLRRGGMYVLGAPPASGKSTFCCQLADTIATQKFNAVYVSYEMGKSQIYLNSLSRLSGLNSNYLESVKFGVKNQHEEKIIVAIEKHLETMADNLFVIEADDSYSPQKIKAICQKIKADFLIVDYLQLMPSGDEKLDSSSLETLRVSKIATELKRLARDLNIAVVAISDINKNAYLKAISGGGLDMGALRDSFKIAHAADSILLLESGNVGPKNQLDLIAEKRPDLREQLYQIQANTPLIKEFHETYAKLSIVKNRGGKLGDPIFIYAKATHLFKPLNLEF